MVYKEWASDPYFCMKAWERYWEIRGKYAEPAADGARRIVSAAVRSAVQVDVFVNGRLLGRYQVADGSIGEVPVPRGMLAREGRFNCVAFVAYGQSGLIVARNYCLFTTAPDRGTN